MTGNVLLKVQPQFPGQDPSVSAVQPGTLMTGPPLGPGPSSHSSFFANLGPLPQPRTVGHRGLPSAHWPLLQCLPHRFQPHLSLRSVVQAVLRGLCSSEPREIGSWGGGGRLPVPRQLPARVFRKLIFRYPGQHRGAAGGETRGPNQQDPGVHGRAGVG